MKLTQAKKMYGAGRLKMKVNFGSSFAIVLLNKKGVHCHA
jgi:hypothetical protein